jgi:hypothetical protein
LCTFNSRRIKQKLYEHTLTDPSENTRAKYRNNCKIYFETIRAAKKLHYSRLLTNHAKDVQKTWSVFNEIFGRSRSNNPVEKINVNGTTVTDPVKIATEFNGFFTSIGKKSQILFPPRQSNQKIILIMAEKSHS